MNRVTRTPPPLQPSLASLLVSPNTQSYYAPCLWGEKNHGTTTLLLRAPCSALQNVFTCELFH